MLSKETCEGDIAVPAICLGSLLLILSPFASEECNPKDDLSNIDSGPI